MKVFITGATGFIGGVLLRQLIEAGETVHLLCRAESKHKLPPPEPSLKFFEGDILDPDSLDKAIRGCSLVYHLAAYARPWAPDPSTFYEINVTGTQNVLAAAARHDVEKAVFTSTAATLPPSKGQEIVEDTKGTRLYTDYERTKWQAEKWIKAFSKEHFPVVIVHPPRVFGPGLLSTSNAMTKIINWYVNGSWRWMPGDGSCIGNYAYVEDIAGGHRQAMRDGKPGEQYILGGTNLTFREFFDILAEVSGVHKTMLPVPVPVIKGFSRIEKLKARLTGISPLITPAWVEKYFQDWKLSSDKAIRELNYSITPIRAALSETLEWLKSTI